MHESLFLQITEQRVAAAQQQVKSRPSGKGKKGVKLTLQQLHSTSDDNISPLNSPPSQTSVSFLFFFF